jgi:hypothetical protein
VGHFLVSLGHVPMSTHKNKRFGVSQSETTAQNAFLGLYFAF